MSRLLLDRIFRVAVLILLAETLAWSSSVKLLYEFSGRDARGPSSNLVVDAAGNAYGVTALGGHNNSGEVYQLSPKSGYHVIYAFSGPDGQKPQGNLTLDADGNLYGTTVYGGTNRTGCYGNQSCGTVFRLNPPKNGNLWTETVLHSFSPTGGDGFNPQAGVIFDSAGNLYGTTEYGGTNGLGTVFELSHQPGDVWNETVILSIFEGWNPMGGMAFDDGGNLFGTTSFSGPQRGGTVFELSPNGQSWTYTLLYAFNGFNPSEDAIGPEGGLILDAQGNLYGTTAAGGSSRHGDFYGYGTVFELSPNIDGTWTESILYSFAGGSDGAMPQTALALDSAGNLYGTTLQGGSGGFSCFQNGCGTVFALIPDGLGGWSERLFRLPKDGHLGTAPSVPGAPLLLNGSVYVTTNDYVTQNTCVGTCGTILQFIP